MEDPSVTSGSPVRSPTTNGGDGAPSPRSGEISPPPFGTTIVPTQYLMDTIVVPPGGRPRDVVIVDYGTICATVDVVGIALWSIFSSGVEVQSPVMYRKSVVPVLRSALDRGYTLIIYSRVRPTEATVMDYENALGYLREELPGVKIISGTEGARSLVDFVVSVVVPSARSIIVDEWRPLELDPSEPPEFGGMLLSDRIRGRGLDILHFGTGEIFPRERFTLSKHLTRGKVNLFILMGPYIPGMTDALIDELQSGQVRRVDISTFTTASISSDSPLLYSAVTTDDSTEVRRIAWWVSGAKERLRRDRGLELVARVLWYSVMPDFYPNPSDRVLHVDEYQLDDFDSLLEQQLVEPPIKIEL